jgi:glycosyltransferase involved in cell wall biosynthesis
MLKKRYCLFSAQYFPTVGGVERYTHSLARCLHNEGHDVAVVTSAQPGLPSFEISPEGFSIYRLPSFQLMQGRLPVLRPCAELSRMQKQLFAQHWDGAVVQTRFYPLSLWAAQQLDKHAIPHIVIEHGSAHLVFSNNVLQKIGNAYEHGITALLKRHCTHFYGVSQMANSWLTHFGIASEGVLYNAVDEEQIAHIRAENSRALRTAHHIDENTKVIAFVGRLVEEKGILSLLKAVQRLLAQNENIHLLIAGDGPLRSEVSRAQCERITPLGLLSFTDVVHCLSESDIFCLPSASEGFCTSVLEAVACECLIVATKVGGVDAIIEDGRSGILLQGTDEESVYQGLCRALRLQNTAAVIANAQRQVEQCGCQWSATTQKTLCALETAKATEKKEGTIV